MTRAVLAATLSLLLSAPAAHAALPEFPNELPGDVTAGEGVSIASGDPLTGPRPADAPDLKSGDPLAPRPTPDASDAGSESEPRS